MAIDDHVARAGAAPVAVMKFAELVALGESSSLSVLTRATGVPKYRMVGSIVLCMADPMPLLTRTLSETCSRTLAPKLLAMGPRNTTMGFLALVSALRPRAAN